MDRFSGFRLNRYKDQTHLPSVTGPGNDKQGECQESSMTIYGLSQSTGLERRLKIERGGQGIVLTIIDHKGGVEQERIMVSSDDLLATITDAAAGGCTVTGVSPPHGAKIQFDVEIRRNEILLKTRADSGKETDVAVGLDDFQDALESVILKE